MAIVALIGGTLAAGSGLLALMTWLETSLQESLTPDEAEQPQQATTGSDRTPRSRPVTIAT